MLSFLSLPSPRHPECSPMKKAPVALRRVAGTASVLASLCVGASFLAPRSVLARRSRRFVRSSAAGRSLRSLFFGSLRYAKKIRSLRYRSLRSALRANLTSLYRPPSPPCSSAPPLLSVRRRVSLRLSSLLVCRCALAAPAIAPPSGGPTRRSCASCLCAALRAPRPWCGLRPPLKC